MSTILSPITTVFTAIFNVIHNCVVSTGLFSVGAGYVMAVLILTILVRLLILPLNIKQMKSQQAMAEIQPEIAKLQKKYKGNPEKANQEMMRLYKENKINPMSGCLPLLIQMPILFALYYVFFNLKALDGVSFLWINNLAGHDPYYILPILAALTTYLSSYVIPKTSAAAAPTAGGKGMNMSTMNVVMAGVMGFMSLQFPAMLVLYWIISNVIQFIQSYFLIILPKKRKERLAEDA